MNRTLALALAPVLIAATAGAAQAGDLQPPGTEAPARTEASQAIQDPTGDAVFAQGDLEGVTATADPTGSTTLVVVVAQYESPFSDDWQLALTDVTWDLDLDLDGVLDAQAGMFGADGQLFAGVIDDNEQTLCQATPSYSEAQRSYSITFATSCIGNPPSFQWRATMTFEDSVTVMQSVDSAPDGGWAGPLGNDAYAPCSAGSIAPGGIPADGFVSLVPARLLDTRAGHPTIDCRFSGAGRVGGTTLVELDVAGRGGVPTNATAVVLNVTATDATDAGFVTVYPCGSPRPTTSNLNYVAGSTVPNAVIATIGTGGKVCLFSNAPTHLVADVNGYFTAASSFVPAGPGRLFDSRQLGPLLPAGSVVPVSVPGGGSSYVLNVTVTAPATAGYATVYPCDSARPVASNLNFRAGDTVANSVIAKAGTSGSACVYLSTSAHLLVDAFGSFAATAGFRTVLPARLLETRSGLSTVDGLSNGTGPLGGLTVTTLQVAGRGGVPASATAAVLNVTVDGASAPGYITVFPCDSPQPLASSLNYLTGSTVPNAVISKIAANGTVCFYTNAATHLVVDVDGYFPAPT